jgi:uncharacterized metal-binding protein YceD (DUF177 family)
MTTVKLIISIPFNVAKIPRKGERIQFVAEAEQFAQIADYLDVDGVSSFDAKLEITPWRKGGIKVEGHINAEMTQTCSITLEAMNTKINHSFDQWFVHQGSRLAQPQLNEEGEIIVDLENPDLPDTYENDTIDFGMVILEQAVLAVDPFPRVEGAEFETVTTEADDEDGKPASPFAVLEQLKNKT